MPPRALVLQARRELQLVEHRAAPLPAGEIRLRSRLSRTFPFDQAPEAYAWLDEHPQDAVKVALDYGDRR